VKIPVGVAWFDRIKSDPSVLDLVDFVEVPGWLLTPEFERPYERLILHNLDLDCSLAASNAIDDNWPSRLRAAVSTTGTPWFSMHLGFAAERVRFNGHMLPVSDPLRRDTLQERIVAAVQAARAACPLQLLLENLDYCPEGAYEHVCDPAFITEVLERTGAGLLFDLGHWQVSASWLGYDPVEALDLIPIERAVEIHLSSPRPLADGSGRLDDAHEPLTGADLDLLGCVLQRVTPRAITIEYKQNLEALREQIGQVRTCVAQAGSR
jgi:hypothetical protein